jgi:histidinol dehydrogenase
MERVRLAEVGWDYLRRRAAQPGAFDPAVEAVVKDVLEAVRLRGDVALDDLSRRFDGAPYDGMPLPLERFEEARKNVSAAFIDACERSAENIRAYHRHQLQRSWLHETPDGVLMGQLVRPIDRAGLYAPGGTASYPSTLLMTAIPAQVAGVPEIILCTSPRRLSEEVLVAAEIAGIRKVFPLGGAQAVAAMAYGTESVPRVDKICGPGSPYVVMAKKLVFGQVGIESLPGPSEILTVADDAARPDWIAADLLSQAEHGGMDGESVATLVTPSEALADAVIAEIEAQLAVLKRREEAEASIRANGLAILTRDLEEAAEVANLFAPEHLELAVADPMAILPLIRHAGAILVGEWTPEPVADYVAGPSHVLPTGGTARFSSPLSTDDFIKKSSLLRYPKSALLRDADAILELAGAEGLDAHAESIRRRLAGAE